MSVQLTEETTEEREAPKPRGFEHRESPPPRRGRRSAWLPPVFHKTWESLRIALSSLRANKLRTALTLVGVVVGVAAVIAVVTIIKGLDQTVASTFSSQGSTVFTVSKRPQVITSREDFIRFNRRKDVTEDDADAVARLCTLCWRTGIAANSQATVKAGDRSSDGVRIRGLTLSMFAIEDTDVVAGRPWTDVEEAAGRDVAVVGPDILDNLFDGAPAEQVIGRQIRIEGRGYEIVGVTERLGKIFGFSRDNFVQIPYPTFKKAFGSHVSLIVFIQVTEDAQLPSAEDQVRAVMRNRRSKSFRDEEDGFALETQAVFIDLYKTATANIYVVTIGVAAISLVVGGIVVMNIMLVSVTERTREIGVRKAVGANRRDILLQFLIESVVITSLGGLMGVAAGFLLAFALAKAMGFPLLFSVASAILGVTVSSAVGIASGIWPAWKASKLDPIEALRSE
ncbi:MAG: putative transport system permease protein [Acidobacteriota bacterium]|jgi:putative ABC transport system permease protein|nr:putative transport system permease protein [Acidobacteriota bacterium]MDT7777589.1 putative transport system permease protein [Acidobacteriota bacterium]